VTTNPEYLELIASIAEDMAQSYRGTGAGDALERFAERVRKGEVEVWEPSKVSFNLGPSAISDLSYFRCSVCGYVEQSKNNTIPRCPRCGSERNMVQAYVGAPSEPAGAGVLEYDANKDFQRMGDSLILSARHIIDIWACPTVGTAKRLKGLMPKDPERPQSSLWFTCPYDDSTAGACRYLVKDGTVRWCQYNSHRYAYVSFSKIGGIKRAPAMPSEAMTKPIKISAHLRRRCLKDITSEFRRLLQERGLASEWVEETCLGEFEVITLVPLYLVGHPYSSRRARTAVMYYSRQDNVQRLIAMGRKIRTYGILFKVGSGAIRRAIKEVGTIRGVNPTPFEVAHSLAHVLVKAVVKVSGVDPREVGESVLRNQEGSYEVLIYDDSPGGVGATTGVVDLGMPDLAEELRRFASLPCPRGCLSACRACLYIEGCGSLNKGLNWVAAKALLAPSS
jgi:DNA-directed RNA polymerase subunit RPC12/RpoP